MKSRGLVKSAAWKEEACTQDSEGRIDIDIDPTERYKNGRAVGGLLAGIKDPTSLHEAPAGQDGTMWLEAAAEKYSSLMEQKVFIMEEVPNGFKVVGSR